MSTEKTPNPYGVKPNNSTPIYQEAKNNSLAIASLILGILSIFLYLFTAIPGIITGHMARSKVNKDPEKYEGKGMALAGLILSYIMLLISFVVIVGIYYLFTNSPEFKDIFMKEFTRGLQDYSKIP